MTFIKSNFLLSLDDVQREKPVKDKDDLPLTTDAIQSFRPVCFKCGVFEASRGSAYVEFGKTRILAQIHGPRENSDGEFHSGIVTIDIKGYEDELSAQLQSSLSACVQLTKYARSEIAIELSILCDDGGILQTALIASSLALIHAGIEMLDTCVACHVSLSPNGILTIDPVGSIPQDNVDITVAIMPNLGQVVCCDVKGASSSKKINEAISQALDKALKLYPILRKSLLASL